MGYGCFDEARAWRELERLLEGQWPDGMVPHIVFHREDPRYFPGPEVWGTARAPRTSGITQPPILAVCARRLLERVTDRAAAEAAVRRLFPKLLAYHRWYHAARDPEATALPDDELVALAHRDVCQALGTTAQPTHTSIVRWSRGIAQYELGHRDQVRSAVAAARAQRIALAGADYRGSGLNDICADADVLVAELRTWS